MTRSVDVAFLPAFLSRADVVLVVDVLRASTTLVTMVERGCGPILLAPTVEAARRVAAHQDGALLVGEAGGLAPPGFAYGNSPVELAAAPIAGRRVVFATTNGAPAVHAAAGASAVLLACLRNAGAAAAAAWAAAPPAGSIAIVCAGRAENPGGFGVDDVYTAGLLVDRLAALGDVTVTDAAEAARMIWAAEPDALRLLQRCTAGRSLSGLGLGEDVTYAAALDRSTTVPRLGRDIFLADVGAAR